jgi:hypothetical protein
LDAMNDHLRWPCSSTSRRSWLSSCTVHCWVLPLYALRPPAPFGVLSPALVPLEPDGDDSLLDGGPSESAGSAPGSFLTAFLGVDFLAPAPALALALPPLPPGRSPLRSSLDAACVVGWWKCGV